MLALALLCFVVAAVWSAIGKAWPMMFLAGGLGFVVLNAHPSLSF